MADLKAVRAGATCDNCPHFWSQHDAWGCQALECSCKRIDRDYWYDAQRQEKITNVEHDLRVRWLPSREQMDAADALLFAGYDQPRPGKHGEERGVYTAHLLLNKSYGFWSQEVELVFLDGVFLTREAVLIYVGNAARDRFFDKSNEGKPLVGGWAWHPEPTVAAVWDDIMSQYPQKERT